jgi:hypothetical protein
MSDAMRETRVFPRNTAPMKIFNTEGDSFLDFGNLQIAQSEANGKPSLPNSNLTKLSRFATVANADVLNIKRIHDALVIGEMTEAIGTDATKCPKFLAMDLARTINRVLVGLNLRPCNNDEGGLSNAYNPDSNTIWELQSTIKVQQELLNELGKSLDYFSKYSDQLSHLNKTLTVERNTAMQSRDDLHMLLVQERREKEEQSSEVRNTSTEPPFQQPRIHGSRERIFFDEGYILDKAFEEFRKNYKEVKMDGFQSVSNSLSNDHERSTIAERLEKSTHKDRIVFSSKILSTVLSFQLSNSPMDIGLKADESEIGKKM